MHFQTADLCDQHSDHLQIAEPAFSDFGGERRFWGRVSTAKLFEDNSRVREAVAEPGAGRVLVVDGGGSLRCALLGDILAAKAVDNGWRGIVINGCVRDSKAIAGMALGVKALAAFPLKSVKRGQGERDVPVRFAGVTFFPGDYLYADPDGIIVAKQPLLDSND